MREENKVLFIGDSHTRGLYDVILKRLNGSDEMALTSFKVANKWEKIGNLDLVSSRQFLICYILLMP